MNCLQRARAGRVSLAGFAARNSISCISICGCTVAYGETHSSAIRRIHTERHPAQILLVTPHISAARCSVHYNLHYLGVKSNKRSPFFCSSCLPLRRGHGRGHLLCSDFCYFSCKGRMQCSFAARLSGGLGRTPGLVSFLRSVVTLGGTDTFLEEQTAHIPLRGSRNAPHAAVLLKCPSHCNVRAVPSERLLSVAQNRWDIVQARLDLLNACGIYASVEKGSTYRSRGRNKRPNHAETQCSAGCISAVALAVASAFVVPHKLEVRDGTEYETRGPVNSGAVDSSDNDIVRGGWNTIGRPLGLLETPVRLGSLVHRVTWIIRDSAETLQSDIDKLNHQLASSFGGQEFNDAQLLWGAFKKRLLDLTNQVGEAFRLVRMHAQDARILWNGDEELSRDEAPRGKGALHWQSLLGDLSCVEAGTEEAAIREVDGRSGQLDRVPQPAAQPALKRTGGRGSKTAAKCSPVLEDERLRPKLPDTNAVYSGDKSGSWLGDLAGALGLFFRTIASVLHRLLIVIPLALSAASAAFWLFMLPYLSAGLQMVGVGRQRVLYWESLVEGELKEVIFMAVTAAASAAGPTYVKFLQWVATRPDLFPKSLCSRCARLQTSVPPFSYPRAALLLREQFGEDVASYLVLDPLPVGCGCIAQVYRAYLLLSADADEKSRHTFLDHAFALGGTNLESVSLEIGNGSKIPPVAVAVKVMRPGVREAMEFDLRVMLLVASALQRLPGLGFVAVKKSVEQFALAMRRQLDFSLEEEHLKQFRSNFGLASVSIPADLLPLQNRCRRICESKHAAVSPAEQVAKKQQVDILDSLSRKILGMRRQVTFPYPFEALSSSDVLVMTLESGFTLNQLFKARAKLQETMQPTFNTLNKEALDKNADGAEAGTRGQNDRQKTLPSLLAQRIIEMVFLDNFFHGDMHSGNLLCRFARNNKECGPPEPPRLDGPLELVVLDCGLAGSLSQSDRVNFVTLLVAIGRKNGRDAAMALLKKARRSACEDEEGFYREVGKLIDEHHFEEGNSLQMSRVRFTSLLGRMLSLSKEYSVELDPSFVSIVVAMSVLEGVGAQLCPEADILKTALPYSLMAAKLLGCAGSKEL